MKTNPNGTSKTAYEWCIEKEIRVTGLEKFNQVEFDFYTEYLTETEFNTAINNLEISDVFKGVEVISGKLHLKSEKYLELRMYTLVPYNLLGIQMGIQHEHSVVQHFLNNVHKPHPDSRRIERWANEWKTSIVLNGGTSNEGHMVRHGYKDVWYVGSMQQYLVQLMDVGINCSTFYEPDLNSMLTGISFIVDERVFNRKLYKDYVETPKLWEGRVDSKPWEGEVELWKKDNEVNRNKWVDKIGGEKNDFLRKFLDPKGPLKLARG